MKTSACLVLVAVLCAFDAGAQTEPADFLMEQASGTSRNPESASMPMLMRQAGNWMLMYHGQAFLNHIDNSGPRGGTKTFSTNWGMGMATRQIGGGTLAFRSMLSLEPATITNRSYPELFQTGETAFGKPLVDAQHPHDFFMELAAEYAHPIGRALGYVYAAPVGDPALGPVAFPHRDSASELPLAPLGHHFEDSTHIAFNVVTSGVTARGLTVEASAFHGGEPDEQRWNIDGGRIDSWAARIRLQPFRDLDLQVSRGRLTKPEAIEPGFSRRTTASASYHLRHSFLEWSSTVVWGEVYKEVHDKTLSSWLGESVLHVARRHHITARFESVEKDELFGHPIVKVVPRPPLPIRIFLVRSYTLGYTFDFLRAPTGTLGIGGSITRFGMPAPLEIFYGAHPHTALIYIRGRLGASMSMHHHDMPM